MSGSGGDRGYDYQADCYAYVIAHGLSGHHLDWFGSRADVPTEVLMETGGAGDDLRIVTTGRHVIEVQAKHALRVGEDYRQAMRAIGRGLLADPTLRGVIMVDRHASQIIREDLRQDLIRLGQGRTDDLKQIAKDLLADFQSQGISSVGVFDRLRIAVVDLDEGNDGITAARAMLGSVVEPKNASTAWALLGKQGHRLIKNRGRDTVSSVADLLAGAVGLRRQPTSPVAALATYRRWVWESTREFLSPVLGKRFPIDQAWSSLRPMEANDPADGSTAPARERLSAEIIRYHEWHRLAEKTGDVRRSDAGTYVRHHARSALIGGPGSGKTTLAQRLTHDLTRTGKLVVRVRLKVVAARLSRGDTFDDALAAAAVDRSGLDAAAGEALLAAPDVLVADGLDECDPDRIRVATDLKVWADARPGTSVYVLTRPVGHVPALLPGFTHAELLPLDREAIRSRVTSFMETLIADPGAATTAELDFMTTVVERGSPSVASIAARNPLLLTCLVRLHVDGLPIGSRRATLFQSIVDVMYKSPPSDRLQVPALDRATAWLAMEQLGWAVLDRPDRSVAELTEDVAAALGGHRDGGREAEAAIAFWESRGLIERLTLGSVDAITFVHPALGEYAAGRYLAKLDPVRLRSEVRRVARMVKYREPLLLAAGAGAVETVIAALLEVDQSDDPVSTQAILAAAVLGEVEPSAVRPATVEQVANRLQRRLVSPIPIVAVEAGEGLVAIAALVAGVVGPAAAALWDHPQPWTRLAARATCLAAGDRFIDTDAVTAVLATFEPTTTFRLDGGSADMPAGSYKLQTRLLTLAVDRVVTELPRDVAEPIVWALASNPNFSLGMHDQLRDVLRSPPYSNLLDRAFRAASGVFDDTAGRLVGTGNRHRLADTFFLKSVLAAVASGRRREDIPAEQCHAMAALFGAMKVGDAPLTQWTELAANHPMDVVAEVIRGAVTATGISADDLGREANALFDPVERGGWLYGSGLPHVDIEADWHKARDAPLDAGLLTAALPLRCYPIARSAAELLAAGVGGEPARGLIRDVLRMGRDWTLLLAGEVMRHAFSDDAFDEIDARLREPLTPGCGYLYEPLRRAATPGQLASVIDRGLEGLQAINGRVASGAAKMLSKLDPGKLSLWAEPLRTALWAWASRGSWCDECDTAVAENSCPICHCSAPTPRTDLIPILTGLQAISVDELLPLTSDAWHGVPAAARDALATFAGRDATTMATLLGHVAHRRVGVLALDAILALPADLLRRSAGDLTRLLDSPHADVRARVVASLSGPWADPNQATELARRAMDDPAPVVRNSAAVALRAINAATTPRTN